ncbi:aminoglycoside phosphotransferase [Shewanella mangrovi]|uniref:Aminoglycoside phosphotransferase n=1 Tax=Shewanella mangrovi TaxID=1515746 RepID=A0A094JFY3_9GAMM|nr:phosphotransferase [Shewanella mangrovi]KFZ36934.1 aminoglycoside phosphotransferase [Shewanella mangrovi]
MQFYAKSHEVALSDSRFLALQQWLADFFGNPVRLTLISGDASFRRYFRVSHAEQHYIVADSPPDKVDNRPFIAIATAYADADIPVPKIVAINETAGFILQQDLGDTQLLSLLTLDNVLSWYRKALALLPSIAQVRTSALGNLPDYDASFVERELAIFPQWLLEHHWQLSLSAAEQQLLDKVFSLLTENALAQPKVGMHRDFHSRNLMVVGDELTVIDFQDAVIGPLTYDAVSLLRDCYVRWPDAVVDELRQAFYQQCQQQGSIDLSVTVDVFNRWFDLMGIQRHIKAAGIFARLLHRDGKSGYIKDIPLTLQYIVDISRRYSELSEFADWVATKLLPLVEKDKMR